MWLERVLTQTLKPSLVQASAARLKSCPDTNRTAPILSGERYAGVQPKLLRWGAMWAQFDCARGYNSVRNRVRYLCVGLLTVFG